MKKLVVVGIICAFFLGFLVLPSLYAGLTSQHKQLDQDMSYAHGTFADNWLLYAPVEYGEMREAPAPFSHSVHAAFACGDCHHDAEGNPKDETMKMQGCMDAGCDDMAVAETPQDRRDIRYFYKAYHDLCMTGCHRDLARAGEPTGPTACPDCHPREE